MKKKELKLLLKDFLETRNLEECIFQQELDMALENVQDGNIGQSALYHLDNMCYEVFKMLNKGAAEEKHLFRFAGFPLLKDENKKEKAWNPKDCPIIQDIKNNAITLSSPKSFNDPMDPLLKAWIERRKIHPDDKVDKIIYQLIEKTLDKIRICCLVDPLKKKRLCREKLPVIDGCNPLMWAHYAKSHTGVCIQYKIKPTNLIDDNNRIVRLLDVDYNKVFPLDGDIPFTDSLVVKANCWSYEKETRLVLYSRKREKDYCQLSNFEIEAVHMGYRIDSEKRNYLKKMLKGSSVKLFQMSFSTDDITKLVSHEIK